MAQFNFNAQNVAPSAPAGAMVPGWYTAVISESDMKATKDNKGRYLELTFDIVAPAQFAGRKQWTRLNVENPSEQAVEIAYGELSAICHAVNRIQFGNTTELHNIPLDIKVGYEKKTNPTDEDRNVLKGFRPCEGVAGASAPVVQNPMMQQQAPQQPANMMQQQPVNNMMQQPAQAPVNNMMQQQQPVQQPVNTAMQQPVQQQVQQQVQQPVQQTVQQPVQQVADPMQAAAAQQMVQQAQQAGQAGEQTAPWQNQQVQAGGTQQVQQAAEQPAQQTMQVQQPATDPNAQQAAQAGLAPWQQQPAG